MAPTSLGARVMAACSSQNAPRSSSLNIGGCMYSSMNFLPLDRRLTFPPYLVTAYLSKGKWPLRARWKCDSPKSGCPRVFLGELNAVLEKPFLSIDLGND